MSSPALDIVIPAYGGTDLLWRCLTHLWLFAPPGCRIVVVDDASPDGTPKIGEWLKYSGAATYIRHSENRGCNQSWLTGIQACSSNPAQHILFVNNDVCMMPGVIAMLMKVADQGYPIVCAKEKNGPIEDGFEPSKYLQPSLPDKVSLSLGEFSGSCFMISREYLNSVGGFDPVFDHAFSDTDLLIRGRDMGVGPVVVDQAIVYHGSSVSSKRMGIMKAMSRYRKDMDSFKAKWANRPEIIEEVAFGNLSPADMAIMCANGWKVGEK
jgi:GT2 family glycosyltransferase